MKHLRPILALLAALAVWVAPTMATGDIDPLPLQTDSPGGEVMIDTVPLPESPASGVMIGTWPTPERVYRNFGLILVL